MKKNLIKELKNSIPPLTKVDINDKGYAIKYFVRNGVISIGDLKQFGEECAIIKNIVVWFKWCQCHNGVILMIGIEETIKQKEAMVERLPNEIKELKNN